MTSHDIALVIAAALPSLIGLVSLQRVGQIHRHVTFATNGQHSELMRDVHDILRRVEALEEELGAAQAAIVAQIAIGPARRHSRRIFGPTSP